MAELHYRSSCVPDAEEQYMGTLDLDLNEETERVSRDPGTFVGDQVLELDKVKRRVSGMELFLSENFGYRPLTDMLSR